MKILNRYIFFELFPPYLFSIFVITSIMLIQEVILITDMILKKGLPLQSIFEMALLSIGHIIALSIPMSVLLSSVMTFGKLSEENEIMAMKASGISLYKLLLPCFFFGLFNVLLVFWFHNQILPNFNFRLLQMEYEIKRSKPTLLLEPGVFNQIEDDVSIYMEELDRKQNILKNLILYDLRDSKFPTTITASKGIISFIEKDQLILLELYNGDMHKDDGKKTSQYTRVRFDEFTFKYQLKKDEERTNMKEKGQREKSIRELQETVDSLKLKMNHSMINSYQYVIDDVRSLLNGKEPRYQLTLNRLKNEKMIHQNYQKLIYQHDVEIHKKLSISLACLIFVLIGVPLGVKAKKGGAGPGLVLSMSFFIFYYTCLMVGEELADNGDIPAWIAMWFANIVMFIFGIWILYKTVQEVKTFQWDKWKFWKKFS